MSNSWLRKVDKSGLNEWLSKVDKEIESICGLGYMDLADQQWADWYFSLMSPREAAVEALENEGFPFE